MSGVRGQSELRLKAARLQRQKSRYKMTAEDKILIVADQLAVVSRQRIIGLEKNIADLKAKTEEKNKRTYCGSRKAGASQSIQGQRKRNALLPLVLDAAWE
jgi:hypothetical protein